MAAASVTEERLSWAVEEALKVRWSKAPEELILCCGSCSVLSIYVGATNKTVFCHLLVDSALVHDITNYHNKTLNNRTRTVEKTFRGHISPFLR